MAKFIFPKAQVFVRETNAFYDAVPGADATTLTCAVPFPANTEATDKVYTLEVYTDDTATGITATVTVSAEATVKYQAAGITANPSTIASEGGTSTVNVTFQAPAV